MLHGCTIGDGSLIGIQAVVLNGARIGRNCLVGAGTVVTEGKEFPDNSLIIGARPRSMRTLRRGDDRETGLGAEFYIKNGQRFKAGLKRVL